MRITKSNNLIIGNKYLIKTDPTEPASFVQYTYMGNNTFNNGRDFTIPDITNYLIYEV